MKILLLIAFFLSASVTADQKAVQAVVEANNKFAPPVYTQVAKIEKTNFLASPFSAETVLALLQSGSEGPTGEELRKGLRLLNNKTEVEEGYKDLQPQLRSTKSYTFLTANKIYVSKRFPIKASFQNLATQVYNADSEDVDFFQNVETANKINKWVEDHTNNKIQNLVSPDNIDGSTIVVLVNTLYFNANWTKQFAKSRTTKQNFYKTETQVVQVDTMHQLDQTFNYSECPKLKAQFLELPFQGGEASMVIALPFARNGLSDLEKNITVILGSQLNLQYRQVDVTLPKFKIETKIDFKKLLQNEGVQKIFDPSQADLSGIGGKKGDLFVNFITQKTYITVLEGGVEAAAATAAGVVKSSAVSPPPQQFVADHPFLFWIRVKGVIVFVGRVTDPKV